MNDIPKVYIDANVLKFSATKLRRLVPKRKKTRNWYGKVTGTLLYSIEYINPNEWIRDRSLKKEAQLLPQVADLAKAGRLRVLMNFETNLEAGGLPNMDSVTGQFYGAPIEHIDSPTKHRRILGGFGCGWRSLQYQYLSGLRHKRFLELQRATGAYQGKKMLNKNQLLDAFHLWCAEQSRCDYFLTLDFKLIRMMKRSKWAPAKLLLVTPSQLLRELGMHNARLACCYRIRLFLGSLVHRIRQRARR